MWRLAADELNKAREHILLLGRKSAKERVITFLLNMDRQLAVDGVLVLPMRRLDIADYLGLTLETVSRSLSELLDEGLLSFSGSPHRVVLHDRERLRNMNG
jgi:CRP/FNR family nitrogen fixation transcriptional regulator